MDCCQENPTPDDNWFLHAAIHYAKHNPRMLQEKPCLDVKNFENGVTNGAKWYFVDGIFFHNT